jgi:hypothetical protein
MDGSTSPVTWAVTEAAQEAPVEVPAVTETAAAMGEAPDPAQAQAQAQAVQVDPVTATATADPKAKARAAVAVVEPVTAVQVTGATPAVAGDHPATVRSFRKRFVHLFPETGTGHRELSFPGNHAAYGETSPLVTKTGLTSHTEVR